MDVALYEAVHSLMESLVPDFDAFGVVRGPSGTGLPGVAPSNTYRCADGKYVVISGNGDGVFRRLMDVIGRPDLAAAPRVINAVKDVPGVTSVLAERLEGGRYLDVVVDRAAAARFGLNVSDIQDVIAAAIGGENIGETIEGLSDDTPANVPAPS